MCIRDSHLILGLAALGIIISAIFGLRAMARIFFGDQTDELTVLTKENKITDLSLGEIVPASLILIPLLFLGLWPRGISQGIDTNISDRYELLEKGDSNYGLPECCPVDQVFKKDTLSEGEGN